MLATKLSSTLLILLLVCLKLSQSGVKKIKIHVPYYVKHVHHYKKVYVPKVHVIKHEHHHKKEYDHHHHHHEVHKRGPYRTYDKSSHEYPDDFLHHDFYYDDIESKSFRTHGKRKAKPWKYRVSGSEQYYGWKDADGDDYKGEDSDEEEDDYTAYRKNYYFKRRSDTGDVELEEADDEANEKKDLQAQEEEMEENTDEDLTEEDSTLKPVSTDNIISLTTTSSTQRPLR